MGKYGSACDNCKKYPCSIGDWHADFEFKTKEECKKYEPIKKYVMELKDFRHLNYVFLFGRVNRVSGYSAYTDKHPMVSIENKAGVYGIHTIDPIPLTTEWLLNFGFTPNTLNGKILSYGNKNIVSRPFIIEPDFKLCNPCLSFKIEYVHQLQNLYFALCGEELVFSSNNA